MEFSDLALRQVFDAEWIRRIEHGYNQVMRAQREQLSDVARGQLHSELGAVLSEPFNADTAHHHPWASDLPDWIVDFVTDAAAWQKTLAQQVRREPFGP